MENKKIIFSGDIDIDCKDRDKLLELVRYIPASRDGTRKHNTGVYVHRIPFDPLSGIATLGYKDAEKRGYFKLDFLNNSVYDKVNSEAHLHELLNTEPDWGLLEHEEFVKELPHIANYADIVGGIKPSSVMDLAVVLALIRPGKRHLVGQPMDIILASIWTKPDNDGYYFKKAHAVAYATTIKIAMNLLVEEAENDI